MASRTSEGGDRTGSGRATGPLEALAFFVELTMLVSLAFAGTGLGGGRVAHILLAVALPVVAVVIWARWMAPSSEHRLADPFRYVAQVVLFVLTAVALGLAGRVVWGVVFAAVAAVVFALTRLGDGVTGSDSRPT